MYLPVLEHGGSLSCLQNPATGPCSNSKGRSLLRYTVIPLTPILIYNGHYTKSRKVAGSIPDEVTGVFSWLIPSSRIMTLVSTQPLTEITTRNLPETIGQPVPKADNLTGIYIWADCLENVGASTSHNPIGLHGLLQGELCRNMYLDEGNTSGLCHF
jgi:hypothetical protein